MKQQLICFPKLILLLGSWENLFYQSGRQSIKNGNIFPRRIPDSENDGPNISAFEGLLEVCSLQSPQRSGRRWLIGDPLSITEGVSGVSITKISLLTGFSGCLPKVVMSKSKNLVGFDILFDLECGFCCWQFGKNRFPFYAVRTNTFL